MIDRSLRQSQALFPFGVGAIMDRDGESFVACDIKDWTTPVTFTEGRLEGLLGVDHFRMPPKYDDRNKKRAVPYYRFPRWFFCPRHNCRKMRFLKYSEETGKRPVCLHCGTHLVPMRLVMACERGHLSDVPWGYWAHRKGGGECKDDTNLEFRMKSGGSGGLESLYIQCKTCNNKNSLEKIMQPGLRCQGRHPWVNGYETCDSDVRILQRNASNLRYDSSIEAISIPPHSDFDYWGNEAIRIRNHKFFEALLEADPSEPGWNFLVDKISGELNIVPDLVEKAARNQSSEVDQSIPDAKNLFESEYNALKTPDKKHHPKDKFQKRRINIKTYLDGFNLGQNKDHGLITSLSRYISRIVVVDRLRCIRVLTGFYRISREHFIPADLEGKLNWLPAIEYFGEGIFFEIESERLNYWENKTSVKERVQKIQERFSGLPEGNRYVLQQFQKFVPTPKFILLHTLAHLLMLRMQYTCGYSMSSIRERIYCSFPGDDGTEMNGILLFTSAGDAEGGMGGLARLGMADNFFPMLAETVFEGNTCSYDPVCIESQGQGLDGMNLAACHSCCLIPETSCTHRNQFLDRGLVCGTMENLEIGYFSTFIKETESIW